VSFHNTLTYQIWSVDVFVFVNGRNGGYLLWHETHARAIKPLKSEEQCAIKVELHCLIQESCADRLTIPEVRRHGCTDITW